jgi:hypothetical protein
MLGAIPSLSIRLIIISAAPSSWITAVITILVVVVSLIAALVVRPRHRRSVLVPPLLVVPPLCSFWMLRIVGLPPPLCILRAVWVIPSPFLEGLRRLLVAALTGFVLEVGLLGVG